MHLLLLHHDRTVVVGTANLLKYLARQLPQLKLYGDGPAAASSVDSWIDFSRLNLGKADLGRIGATLETLETHLRMRVYLVGYSLTLADLIVFDALKREPLFFFFCSFPSSLLLGFVGLAHTHHPFPFVCVLLRFPSVV